MTYLVKTERFGWLAVERATRAEVRAWAVIAFPQEKCTIRLAEVRLCQACDSAPCCCKRARQ